MKKRKGKKKNCSLYNSEAKVYENHRPKKKYLCLGLYAQNN